MLRGRSLCWAAGVLVLSGAAAGCGASNSGLTAGPARAMVALDLRKVDWPTVTLPGSACDGSQPIRLHRPTVNARYWPRDDGTAFVRRIPRQWAGDFFATSGLTIITGPVVYGDLDGSGHADAALMVDCTNGSGTADGEIAFSWVIFSGRHDRLSVVGVLSARAHHPSTDPPTVINIAIRPGKITAWEYWDFHLPGSGHWAATIWSFSHGTLRPGVPRILRQAPGWFRACIARGDGDTGCSLDANPNAQA